MRTNDYKGRCLWNGVIRLLWPEGDAGGSSMAADQKLASDQKLAAFALNGSPFSEEAALKLPEVLAATVVAANEAGAGPNSRNAIRRLGTLTELCIRGKPL